MRSLNLNQLRALEMVVEVGSFTVVPRGDIILRPLAPPLVRAIAMAWRRDKPSDPALRIVREALMTLRDVPIAPRFEGGKGAAPRLSDRRKTKR